MIISSQLLILWSQSHSWVAQNKNMPLKLRLREGELTKPILEAKLVMG